MCGIAGVLSLGADRVDASSVERMIEALAHRGPDGHGIHVDGRIGLAHRRLSILDPTPAGAQPMVRDGNVLVHNGEIYNYLELAAELRDRGQRIDSATDTEVILAAYKVWGLDALSRFNGMFAFALWDASRRSLILARDRMGVKPLYLRRSARSLAFASEPAALVAGRPMHGGDTWAPEPHLGVVRDFLIGGKVDNSPLTFFDGVTSLRPGHVLVIEDGVERTVRYWAAPVLADDARGRVSGTDLHRDRELVAEFRDLFDSSVRLRLRSDVPIGTCLSGGLDSSAIVMTIAEMAHGGRRPHGHEQLPRLAFHARFPAHGIDESAFAESVAAKGHVRLIHRTPTGHPLIASVVPVLRAQGEPYGGASVNAQHAVMSAAHDEDLRVLLDGQGADELLGGYLQSLGVRSAGLLGSGDHRGLLAELRGQVSRGTMSPEGAILSTLRSIMPGQVTAAARSSSGGRLQMQPGPSLRGLQGIDTVHGEPGTRLARYQWQLLTADVLPALLRYEDRNSMAFGIEARVPFLDYRLVEMAVRLPDRMRIDRGVTKVILRRAMRRRLPHAVLDRRDKMGFMAPQREWLLAGRREVAALLRGGQAMGRGWVTPSEVERLLVDGRSSRRSTDQLWRLFITEAWLRMMWPGLAHAGSSTWKAGVAAAHRPVAS